MTLTIRGVPATLQTADEAAAHQQPHWDDPHEVSETMRRLADLPPIALIDETTSLRERVAAATRGECFLLHFGDCAERLEPGGEENSRRLAEQAIRVAATLEDSLDRPVAPILRTAGQFAKPRSSPTQGTVTGDIPAFRGHIVNAEEPTLATRRPSPARMLHAYAQSARSVEAVRSLARSVWVSHEALLLPYELAQVRTVDRGVMSTSAHLLWIGERTRAPAGHHVKMLEGLHNPIGCKIGPGGPMSEVVETLDRLTANDGIAVAISRFGVESIDAKLRELIERMGPGASKVAWMCDPMHGNVRESSLGRTRPPSLVMSELARFLEILEEFDLPAAGIHLEATWRDVQECWEMDAPHRLGDFESLMDPRLNSSQLDALVDWLGRALGADALPTNP